MDANGIHWVCPHSFFGLVLENTPTHKENFNSTTDEQIQHGV